MPPSAPAWTGTTSWRDLHQPKTQVPCRPPPRTACLHQQEQWRQYSPDLGFPGIWPSAATRDLSPSRVKHPDHLQRRHPPRQGMDLGFQALDPSGSSRHQATQPVTSRLLRRLHRPLPPPGFAWRHRLRCPPRSRHRHPPRHLHPTPSPTSTRRRPRHRPVHLCLHPPPTRRRLDSSPSPRIRCAAPLTAAPGCTVALGARQPSGSAPTSAHGALGGGRRQISC